MFAHRVSRFVLFAAAGFAANAQAQVDSLSLNFEKARFEFHAAQTGAVPFALDLVHGEDGAVSVHTVGGHNLTFKRGQFYPADSLPQSWLFFDMQTDRRGAVGVLAVGVDQAAGGAAKAVPHIKVIDGRSDSAVGVHTGGVQVLMGDGSVRFLRDSVDVRLRGEPAELFNQPGPGEALVARLPTPAVGQTIRLRLTVSDNVGASMSMPVRITRPR